MGASSKARKRMQLSPLTTFGVASILLSTLSSPDSAYGLSGDLDTSFGTSGTLINQSIGGASALAIQADGKLVAVTGDWGLARYNPNGSLDTSFDGDGLVTTSFPGGGNSEARDVAIQTDGRIVVVGTAGDFFALARYNTNGTLDGSFGTGGIAVTTSVGEANAVGIELDGKIVVAGRNTALINNGAGEQEIGFFAARFNSNGTLQTILSLRQSGGGLGDFGAGSSANAIATQADGKVVIVGNIGQPSAGSSRFATVRYSAGGNTPDPSFSNGTGIVFTDVSGDGKSAANAIAIQRDSKIVVAGTPDSSVARFNANGSLDTTFNSDGKVTTTGLVTNVQAVAIQADGKIVVGGFTAPNNPAPRGLAALRYSSQGNRDAAFSGDAMATATFTCLTIGNAMAMAIQKSNGRIVVAGPIVCQGLESGTDLSVARFHAFECGGKNVTILGTDSADTLSGTNNADVILGLGGNDTISAFGGNDTICGGSGNDVISGGVGNDNIRGDNGNDAIGGDDGDDIIRGGSGNDSIRGGNGDDRIQGEDGNDTLVGNAGADALRGGPGTDVCVGTAASGDTFNGC